MEIMQGLITLTTIHFLATASPGPEFVLISKQALTQGRKLSFLCLFGTVLGLVIHLAYSSFGLASLISSSPTALWVIKILGGSYLVYLGINGLRSKPATVTVEDDQADVPLSTYNLIKSGFICDLLNPKAPVYYVSLFTFVLSPNMPAHELLIYGVWMVGIHVVWFSIVVTLLSTEAVNAKYKQVGHWFDRVFGTVMVGLGFKILFSDVE